MNQDTKLFGIMVLLAISLMVLFSVVQCSSEDDSTPPAELIIKYKIQIEASAGGSVSSSGGEYTKGTSITLTATPNAEYVFSGWSNGSNQNPLTLEVNSNLNLTASFEKRKYALTINIEGEGTVTEQIINTGKTTDYDSGTTVRLTANPSEGWIFRSWSGAVESEEISLDIVVNETKEVNVVFDKIIQFTLRANPGTGGSINVNGDTFGLGEEVTINAIEGGDYEIGDDIQLKAIESECYNFIDWSDGSTEIERIITLNEDINLSVNFSKVEAESIFQSLIEFKQPCVYNVTIDKSYNEKENYKVGKGGWLTVTMNEFHEAFYYPTSNDYNSEGYFTLDHHNFALGDFNKDGLQDVVIAWAIFPHTLERESKLTYTIFINNGDGTLTYDKNIISTPSIHNVHFAYRTLTADFNNDGIDDIVSASMGVIKRLPNNEYYTRWDRIPLLLSSGNGTFYDASTNIEGQEDGVSPPNGHTFGHEISIGDVDGDGDIDIYTGKILLLNDGTGNFKNNSSSLPIFLGGTIARKIWSSVIADFNNDGIDDFFVPYAEPESWSDFPEYSGVYSLSKEGFPSYENSHIGFVTEALYGIANTKFNYAIDYDINLDGFQDIVIACTRANPYYQGRALQIFLNEFDPETRMRKFVPANYLVSDQNIMDNWHGEGQLTKIDINNDGVLDIVHTVGSYGNEYGISLYINNGGILELYPFDKLPYVTNNQIEGREGWVDGNKIRRAIPINLNNDGWIDLISIIENRNNENQQEKVFYSILSK